MGTSGNPVGFPEDARRKFLIPDNIRNYEKPIFSKKI
jgi:hypothetical protein